MADNKILIKQQNYNPSLMNLLLIHGWGFNSQIWEHNLPYLQKKYNIYTLDLNGHGENSYNSSYENLNLYLDEIVNNLFTMDACNNFSILGWSLGGIIALCLKQKYPKLINKILLCCSSPCFLSKDDWSNGVEENIWNKFQSNLLSNQDKTIKEFLLLQTMGHENSKELYKTLLDIYNRSTPATLEGLKWGLNLLNNDYRNHLKDINSNDISFLFGNKDRLVNKLLSEWLSNHHPRINTLLLNNSGHMPFITETDLFYQFINDAIKTKQSTHND